MPASNSNPPADGAPGDRAGDGARAPRAAPQPPLGLFDAYGIEVEYVLVDGDLDVAPAADQLLEAAAGEHTDEFENGAVAWNNELALHVIEFKCNGPRPSLAGLGREFSDNVDLANAKLAREGLRLMPTAMHPWMDPKDVELWPHGTREVYDTFDRIFSCKGHGWANLQSMQINLPFNGDEEFARLHAAIRFLLPILPALAASSPIVDGELNGILDNRLVVYRGNCAKIPSITGEVIPEPMGSIGEYHERLLGGIYRDLESHDPEGVLRHEWVNARGAIARFDRMAIEIRVLDVQETPRMDVAFAAVIAEVLKLLCTEEWGDRRSLDAWRTTELAKLLALTERQAETAGIGDRRYLAALGFRGGSAELHKLWEHLIETATARGDLGREHGALLEHYLRHGSLATRIHKAVGLLPTRAKLMRVYEELCEGLATGTPFTPPRRLVFSCEHGGNEIPAEYAALFDGAAAVLDSHRGLDYGALETVRSFGKRLGVEPIVATVSRLVCDLNRSPHHRNVFSEYTRPLDREQRAAALDRYYWPYRRQVERAVDEAARGGAFVLHVSSHSFTPVLNGVVRRCDVGFLYDPRRAAERGFIEAWHAALAVRAPELAIRRNYPYKGTTDALVTHLRRRHGDRSYAGVEVEVNQKHAGTAAGKRLVAALADSLEAAVGEA